MSRKRLNPAIWTPAQPTDAPLSDGHTYEVHVEQGRCEAITFHYSAEAAELERQFQTYRYGGAAKIVQAGRPS